MADQDPSQYDHGEVCSKFGVRVEAGLNDSQVKQQREKFGPNKLEEEAPKSLLALVMEQFEDTLVRILLVSAAVSAVLAFTEDDHEGITAYVEPLVILTILFLNAIVGVWQNLNADAALEALKKLVPSVATVTRDGNRNDKLDAEDLVPGDIVHVRTGEQIPADIRLIRLETTTLSIDQSSLTGESQSVRKEVKKVDNKEAVIQDKHNMIFSGTYVFSGSAIGIVVATGMTTEMGKIQAGVTEAAKEQEATPLQQKLEEFGNDLAKMIFVICILVWAVNYKHFNDPVHGGMLKGCIYYFKIAVALAVAAIPEGLPTVITMCLALGTKTMAQRNCIVRKLPSVETLGCTTVICSDKTGTLTTNQMCVVRAALPQANGSMKELVVSGTSYDPFDGRIQNFDEGSWSSQEQQLTNIARVGALCNMSRLNVGEDGKVNRDGEPTEAAIRVFVEKLGCPEKKLQANHFGKRRGSTEHAMAFSTHWKKGMEESKTLEFDRDRKSMSVLYKDQASGKNVLYVKGASEMVFARCNRIMLNDGTVVPIDATWKQTVSQKIEGMAKEALRTIGLAIRTELQAVTWSGGKKTVNLESIGCNDDHEFFEETGNFIDAEKDMIFCGMVGILDPPRPECEDAVATCKVAGITVIMITGDNKTTAEAIATKLGILKAGKSHKQNSFTGKEFEALTEQKRWETLKNIMAQKDRSDDFEGAVFSRTEPTHKRQIVKILKNLDEVAAMTGDGVNDAPALKEAAIGIAMGIAGTEVAKNAADMILQDDNFQSIVAAVAEGRSIYSNMKAFIRYMISSNVGEVAAIFFTAALGIPEGLTPVQLLWVNLVTDGPPATALGLNPKDVDVMLKPPRKKSDALISTRSYVRYMVVGLYVGFAVIGIFIYWFCYDQGSVAGLGHDGQGLVTYNELTGWANCQAWTQQRRTEVLKNFTAGGKSYVFDTKDPARCTEYFTDGKVKASSLSLTVLVVIEMLNAFNALSEDGSLYHMPPWANPWLIIMASLSVGIHMVVLYWPPMNGIFAVCPLTLHDWGLVMSFSMPVLLIDEMLKFVGRMLPEDGKRRGTVKFHAD